MSNSHRKKRKKRRKKTPMNRISSNKLIMIFIGSVFVLFGFFIGDFKFHKFCLPAYASIFIGLTVQLITILIFVKQNSIKTSHA